MSDQIILKDETGFKLAHKCVIVFLISYQGDQLKLYIRPDARGARQDSFKVRRVEMYEITHQITMPLV